MTPQDTVKEVHVVFPFDHRWHWCSDALLRFVCSNHRRSTHIAWL